MTQNTHQCNTVAPLENVARCLDSLQRAIHRPYHLPGMVVFYGPSGFGKSTAAGFVRNKFDALYVECKSTWTKKALLTEILKETGLTPAKTNYDMYNQICEHLTNTRKPLIIDEMDYLVDKKAVEIVRDIYEGSKAPILLIGEEQLPQKLERWERFHGRILDWTAAQPVSLNDVAHLSHLYCPGAKIDEDLLVKVHQLAKGSIRRVCVNLSRIEAECRRLSIGQISLNEWGTRELYTGKAPARRL